jgi:hypothetical protein
MNNTEKGKLLANLFPEQLQGIVDNLMATQRFLADNEDSLRSTWDNALLSFDFWYRQANEVTTKIERHSKSLTKSSSLFAEQLFAGYNALYTIDCIVKQAQAMLPLPENTRYILCVRLLFDHYTVTSNN